MIFQLLNTQLVLIFPWDNDIDVATQDHIAIIQAFSNNIVCD